MAQLEFNALYEDPFIKDPIPKLLQAQEQFPLLRLNPGLTETYHVFGYDDILEILRNPDIFSSNRALLGEEDAAISEANLGVVFNNLISADPPRHTRLRALANRGFLPKIVRQFQPKAEQVVGERMRFALQQEEFDLVEDFSAQITTAMITTVLGLPVEDWPQIREWTNVMALNNGSTTWMRELEEDRVEISNRVACELADYFHDYLIDRKKNPREGDIVSALMTTEVDGERFNDDEIQSTVMLLLLAGNETTTNLITNFVRCMVRFPEQGEKVRRNLELVPNAIEETLRFESSIRYLDRFVKQPVTLHGVELKEGTQLCLWLPAANRDPRIFDCPNDFDIERKPNRHLAFSTGPHLCLGAPLARMESQIAARAIMEQTEAIELIGEPEYAANAAFNNILSQKVRFIAR